MGTESSGEFADTNSWALSLYILIQWVGLESVISNQPQVILILRVGMAPLWVALLYSFLRWSPDDVPGSILRVRIHCSYDQVTISLWSWAHPDPMSKIPVAPAARSTVSRQPLVASPFQALPPVGENCPTQGHAPPWDSYSQWLINAGYKNMTTSGRVYYEI